MVLTLTSWVHVNPMCTGQTPCQILITDFRLLLHKVARVAAYIKVTTKVAWSIGFKQLHRTRRISSSLTQRPLRIQALRYVMRSQRLHYPSLKCTFPMYTSANLFGIIRTWRILHRASLRG